MANRNIKRAVRLALFAAGTAGVGIYAAGALAQDTEVEQIIVTGSRIPQPNIEGSSPVSVMSAQDVSLTGAQKIENLMNNMPQVFAAQGGNLSNGSTGTATLNLRNLGEQRTLVLINGRRMVAGDPGYAPPDVNQIPTPLIERVEVLTGGASAVYGSDAVAGVVNFIMKDNFQGIELNANHSFYNHENDNSVVTGLVKDAGFKQAPNYIGHDGATDQISVLMGSNFADDRGNATLFLGWQQTDGLLQSQRDYSACAVGASGTSVYCGGSSASYPGRFRPDGLPGLTIDSAGNPVSWDDFGRFYNYAPLNYWQRPDERWTAAAFMHYDLNEHARAYGEFMYMDDHSVSQIAPSGAFAYQVYQAPCDGSNPLLSDQWLSALCGDQTTGTNRVRYARRNVEGGGRQADLRHDSSRFVVGLKGDVFDGNWNYDVSGTYSQVAYQSTYLNDFSKVRIARALDVVQGPTGPTCRSVIDGSDPNCVPWDIWSVYDPATGLGGPSAASINYLQIPLLQSGYTKLKTVDATLSSDLGKYGIQSPLAHDAIGVSFGAQYSEQSLNLYTDAAYQINDGAGQGGPTLPVSGGYNNTDLFAEVRVPIVQDMVGAQELTLNGSYRRSDYSKPIDETTNTYGIGLDWAPIKDIKLRGSYQRAVRAPNIIELYQTAGLNLWSSANFDPCASNGTATLEECLRTGLTEAQYNDPAVRDDLVSSAGQYNYIQSGNSLLKPETSDSYTYGVVFQPSFVPGLSLTVDYFDIKVDDVISTIPPDLALGQCAATGSPLFCGKVHRDADGTLWASPDGYVTAINENLGSLHTSGIDVDLRYTLEIGSYGSLNTSFAGTYLNELTTKPLPGTDSVGDYDCVGLYGGSCGTPTPEWRHNMRVTWNTPWNVDLSLAWRYFGGVTIAAADKNELLAGDYPTFSKTIDSQDYLDVAAVWRFAEKYTINFGINNVTDEDPPIVDGGTAGPPYGNGNTYPQVYDALGRYVFMGLTAKF